MDSSFDTAIEILTHLCQKKKFSFSESEMDFSFRETPFCFIASGSFSKTGLVDYFEENVSPEEKRYYVFYNPRVVKDKRESFLQEFVKAIET